MLQCVLHSCQNASTQEQNSPLQYVAVCCSVLQCVAVCCRVLQGVAECTSFARDASAPEQNGPINALQCVAVCCRVSFIRADMPRSKIIWARKCVAVWCSVLQCVAVWCVAVRCQTRGSVD